MLNFFKTIIFKNEKDNSEFLIEDFQISIDKLNQISYEYKFE
jgi:hypothetical protein